MSKVLVNNNSFDVIIADTGVTIAANASYVIPPQDYLIFAASSNTISFLADGTLVLNDGSADVVDLSQAVDILKGWCPSPPVVPDPANGTTSQYVGVVDDSPVPIPDAAGDLISTVLVRCPAQVPQSNRLNYSFDGGLTFGVLSPGEFVGWSLKGSQTQIFIVGNVPGVKYEVVVNRVPA